jgi:hypothetical protein
MTMRALAAGAVAAAIVAAALFAFSPSTRGARSDECGEERWDVKTLTDTPEASAVDLAHWKTTTIEKLRRLNEQGKRSSGQPPKDLKKTTPRMPPVETTVYSVTALLMSMKREKDKDIHLVIADPKVGGSMIVEFPADDCTVGASAAARAKMQGARKDVASACGGEPGKSVVTLTGKATIRGVGFFDLIHGQGGVAPNGIELHPVLSFTGASCSRVKP